VRALAAKDPHLCVNFLNGGESQGFFELSAQYRCLVAAMAMAGIDAILDNEIKRIERPAPAGADFDAVEEALRAKDVPAKMGALNNIIYKFPRTGCPEGRKRRCGRVSHRADREGGPP
jgi:hypothetical protein